MIDEYRTILGKKIIFPNIPSNILSQFNEYRRGREVISESELRKYQLDLKGFDINNPESSKTSFSVKGDNVDDNLNTISSVNETFFLIDSLNPESIRKLKDLQQNKSKWENKTNEEQRNIYKAYKRDPAFLSFYYERYKNLEKINEKPHLSDFADWIIMENPDLSTAADKKNDKDRSKKIKFEKNNFYELTITTKFKDTKKKSISIGYFTASKSGRLSIYKDSDFNSTGKRTDFGFVEHMENANLLRINDSEYIQRLLFSRYKTANNILNNEKWFEEDKDKIAFSLQIKNVTDKVHKKAKDTVKIEPEDSKKLSFSDKLIPFDSIPAVITDLYEKMGKKITPEQYTSNMFNMVKEIFSIPPEKRILSKNSSDSLKNLFKEFDKTDKSDKELIKKFNEFSYKYENKKEFFNLIHLFALSRSVSFKGWKKNLNSYQENESINIINAIKSDNFPIMKAQDTVDYIVSPNGSIYPGYNQLALQMNNDRNGIKCNLYQTSQSLAESHKSIDTDKKQIYAQIIDNGKDANGNNSYSIVYPTIKTRLSRWASEIRKRKEIQDYRNENIKKIKEDLKYYKKHGLLPDNNSNWIISEQKPVKNAEILKHTHVSEKFDGTNIENFIKNDLWNVTVSRFAKIPYAPSLPYTEEPYKSAFLNYAQKNADKIITISNKCHSKVSEKLHQQTNELSYEQTNNETKAKSKNRRV